MKDEEILALYNARSEEAVVQTARKYGAYCHTVAYRILENESDAEECVNDTYLRAWAAIPPEEPRRLGAYLATITRRLSLNVLRRRHSEKNGGGQLTAVLEELQDCLPSRESTEALTEDIVIRDTLNRFLAQCAVRERHVFLCRYFRMDTTAQIAREQGTTENYVYVTLHRLRKKLRGMLEKEGIVL